VDIRNQNQATPLHIAIAKGDLPSVKVLLGHGANTSLRDQAGNSVLHTAAASDFEKIVQMVLDHKVEIDAYDTSGKAYQNHSYMQSPTTNRRWCDYYFGERPTLTFSPKSKVNLPSPLHQAVRRNLLEVVETPFEYKVDLESPRTRNQTPLVVACQLPDNQIALRLLAAGADVEAKFESVNSILPIMVRKSNFPVVQLLIDNKAMLNLRSRAGGMLLHQAVAKDLKEAIDFLLKNHIDVDAKDSVGLTALMLVAEHDRAASVHILKEHGASINTQDRNRNTRSSLCYRKQLY